MLHRLISNLPIFRKGALVHLKIHIVQSGESIEKIAQKFNKDVDELMGINSQIDNFEAMLPGTKIKIPQKRIQVNMLNKPMVNRHTKTQDMPINIRRLSVIEEDDTWKSTKPILNKMIHIAKSHPSDNKRTTHGLLTQSARYNPINLIRNSPNN